jgi:alanyl-tRNA synthetase
VQSRKLIDSGKVAAKQQQKLLAEIADLTAQQSLSRTQSEAGRKIIVGFFAERDLAFVKLFAQRVVAAEANVVALVGAGQGSVALIFAQSAGGSFDAGSALKAIVASVGGRGGGTRDLAQGGVPSAEQIPELLERAVQMVRASVVQPAAQE